MIDAVKKWVIETAQQLEQRGHLLATAESCTGGGLSYWLTSVPGSSNWFDRGFVTYSNQAKVEMLGVKQDTLNQFGAVSEETAREMAVGALKWSDANLSIAITGIAGPDGGSPDKPVGLVWFGWAGKNFSVKTQKQLFSGDRQGIRLAAMAHALETLLKLLA